jgi:hypothetical protein
MANLMILPASPADRMRLVAVPDDIEVHDAYRHVTGIIAAVQEENPECTWEDMQDALEAHGFEVMDYMLGPELACSH